MVGQNLNQTLDHQGHKENQIRLQKFKGEGEGEERSHHLTEFALPDTQHFHTLQKMCHTQK